MKAGSGLDEKEQLRIDAFLLLIWMYSIPVPVLPVSSYRQIFFIGAGAAKKKDRFRNTGQHSTGKQNNCKKGE